MAHLSPQLVEERINKFGKLYLIDEIIRRRAQDEEQVPILGYPKYEDNAAVYEFFTGKDLDRMVDAACRALVAEGFKVVSVTQPLSCHPSATSLETSDGMMGDDADGSRSRMRARPSVSMLPRTSPLSSPSLPSSAWATRS